jgi:hypothetical protein
MISSSGQRVLEGQLAGTDKQIDVSQFSAGMYYLNVKKQMLKLIKQYK